MKAKVITLAQLQAKRACYGQINLFTKVFGTEVKVTKANAVKAAKAGFDIGWASENLLTPTAYEAYKAVKKSAWEAYKAVKKSAWEAYKAVEKPAYEAYVVAIRHVVAMRPAYEAYVADTKSAWEAYKAVEKPASKAYDAACWLAFYKAYNN